MKKILLIVCLSIICFSTQAQTKVYPVIKEFGAVYLVPFAIDKPDPSLNYKIIIDASLKIDDPKEIYPYFDHIARMYNLHIYGGIPQKKLHIAVAVASGAIFTVLDNEAYQAKYGVDNPNLKIIKALKDADIELFACGQSIMHSEIDPGTVNTDFNISVSRFTTITTYQMKGYALYKF
jgi:intracellular sulfur oxidation DsrE/DsrF family protein